MRSFKEFLLTESKQKHSKMHGDRWAGTSWTDTMQDGRPITVTIQDIFNFSKNIPVSEIDTGSLKSIALHNNKTDKETINNIQKANLDYPILVLKKQDKTSILDGHHRLQKAINNNIPKIKAKVIDINSMPKDWKRLFR